MLSVPHSQLLTSAVTRTASLPLGQSSTSNSPEHSSPAISVTRPSRVSASVDDSALDLLRAKYNEQSRDRCSSLSVADIQESKSAQSSPKLRRSASFRARKIFRTSSNGVDGYDPLNASFADEANQFSRERVTSVKRALSRTSSFTSTPPSPRPYRAMVSLVPAKHRIAQLDSSDEEEEEEEGGSTKDLVSPVSESDLDFGSGSRLAYVSALWS